MATDKKQLNCGNVCVSVAGDYSQIMFERTSDSDEDYLLLQPQFDTPSRVDFYVETEKTEFCGHYRVHNAILARSRVCIRYGDEDLARSRGPGNGGIPSQTARHQTLHSLTWDIQDAGPDWRRCVAPPHATNVQFRTAGILTADFDEATQCGQHFVPSWGPW